MKTYKIQRWLDGRVIAICDQCGATSGTPQPEGHRVRDWQQKHRCERGA